MERKLRLTGKGEFGKSPDTIEISLTVVGEDSNYEKAMKECDESVIVLKEKLVKGGFEENNIKTTNFRVNTINKYVESFKTQKYVFDRYSVNHSMQIKFAFDRKALSKCVDIITSSLATPRFTINFTVSDTEDIKKKALENAVKEASEEAKLLAKSAGVELGEITLIDHSFSQINIYRPRNVEYEYDRAIMSKASSSASMESINVEDIKVTANVTMEWGIK